jgi:predicted PurR-regulated permease PerM
MFFLDVRTARAAWTVLLFAVAIALVWFLRRVLLLFAFSLFFAYLIFPLVRLVQHWLLRGHSRPAAIGVVYLLLLLALGGIGAGVGPRLSQEVRTLAEKVPQMSQQLQSGELVGSMLERHGWEAESVREAQATIRSQAQEIISHAQGALAGVLKWLAGAWVIVLVPIFAFFILKDAELMMRGVEALIADRPRRRLWRDIAADVHLILAGYVRALLLLSFITFAVWSLAFFIAGVPYALVLAAVGGGLEFIPVVGPLVAGVIVVSVGMFSGYEHPWLLVLFVLLWRFVQDYVTSPLVMRHGIEIHPALVILGVIAGGEIGGPAGMFLSVPVIAALRIVWRHLKDFYDARDSTVVPGRP